MKKMGLSRSKDSMTKVIAKLPMAPVSPVIAAVTYWGETVNWVEGKHSLRILS